MYEERKRIRINWVSFLLKLILFFIVVIIICLIIKALGGKDLFSKKDNNVNYDYISSINYMKDSAFEYFKDENLPKKVGNSKSLTLREMIDQKLVIDFTNDGKRCDLDNSYVKATMTSDYNYALKVALVCGKKDDYIVTTIENTKKACTDAVNDASCKKETEEKVDTSNQESSTTESSNDNSSSSSSTSKKSSSSSSSTKKTSSSTKSSKIKKMSYEVTNHFVCTGCCNGNCKPNDPVKPDKPSSKKVTYYKHVKYSDWIEGYKTGINIENKTEKVNYQTSCNENKTVTYYAAAAMSNNTLYNTSYSFRFKLNLSNASNVVVKSHSYFNSTDYSAFMNQSYKPMAIIGETVKGPVCFKSTDAFRSASLNSNNFKYTVGNITQSGGSYYLNVTMKYINAKGANPMCNCATSDQLFFLPIKVTVNYTENKTCTCNKTVSYYRYVTYKWTTNKNEPGYTYTGVSVQKEVSI